MFGTKREQFVADRSRGQALKIERGIKSGHHRFLSVADDDGNAAIVERNAAGLADSHAKKRREKSCRTFRAQTNKAARRNILPLEVTGDRGR